MRTLGLVVLLLLAPACGMPEDGPDAVVVGANIWWGDRVHDDAYDYLTECARFLGRSDFDGMNVIFEGRVGYVTRNCGQKHVAGCTIQARNAAVIHDRPSIWNTALCHEAVHVYLAPFDNDHAHEIWEQLGAAGLNGSPHEEAALGEAQQR